MAADYEVPVGVIREFTRWYAIRLQTTDGQLFLARKEPGQRTISNEMHLIIGPEIALPAATALTGNTDREAVVKELSRRLGMMEQALAESPFDKAYTEPPTIRNVAPFLFQPQNVIANKDTLFYKTDPERHQQHRQRLQRIFPFVLGAINAEYFQLKNDLDIALRELRKWERQLSEYRALAGDGISVARALWDRAGALGLVKTEEPSPQDGSDGKSTGPLDLAELHARLAALVDIASMQLSRAALITGNPERVALLETQSRTLRTEIATLRQQLAGAEELSQEASLYTGTLRLQSGRLRAITVLKDTVEETHTCPLCNQHLNGSVPGIERLRTINEEVRAQLTTMAAANPTLGTHIEDLRNRILERRTQLARIEAELAELYRTQEDLNSTNATWAEQQRQLGAIRFYLERTQAMPESTSDLERRVREARRRVEHLQDELTKFDTADRLESALGVIAQMMSEMSKHLNLERQDAALRLDIKRLTVVRDSPSGKPERLYEIGSGENWVGYHLCALFALHSFFIRRNSPVPSILFLDQPSQIYFPEEKTLPSGAESSQHTDWDAVRQIYRMIFDTVQNLNNRLQIIVLDHADLDDPAFVGAVRARWRDGHQLI